MPPDTRLGILIDAQNKAQGAIGQAINEVKKLDAALKEAKRTADGSVASNQNLGKAVTDLAAAKVKLRDATLEANRSEGQFIKSLGVVSASVAAVGAVMVGLTRNVANVAEESENLQTQLGLTAGGVGALKVISGESGIAFQTLSQSVNRLNVRIGEARNGNEDAVKTFKDLRVSLNDANGNLKTTEQLTSEVAQAIVRIADPAERARLSMETFGRGGTRALRALSENFEEAEKRARELGVTIEGNVLRTAVRADQAFDRLTTATNGLKNSIGALAAVSITPLIEDIAKLAEEIAKAAKAAAEGHPAEPGSLAWFMNPTGYKKLGPKATDPNDQWFLFGPKSGRSSKDVMDPAAAGAAFGQQRVFNVLPAEKAAEAEKKITAEQEKQLEILKAMADLRNFITGGGALAAEEATLRAEGMHPRDVKATALPRRGHESTRRDTELKKMKEAWEEAGEQVTALGKSFGSTLSAGLASAIVQAKNLGDVLKNVLGSAIEQLLSIGVGVGLKSIFPFMSQGGSPVFAASGVAVSGMNGIDSLNVRMHRGEMAINHTDTQNLMRTMREMQSFMRQPTSSAGDTFQITVNANGGGGQDWSRIARDDIIREIQRHQRLGTARR